MRTVFQLLTRDISRGYHGERPESVARNAVVDLASCQKVMAQVGTDLAMLSEALGNGASAWDVLNSVKGLVAKCCNLTPGFDPDDFQAECALIALIEDYQDFIGDPVGMESPSTPPSPLLAV